MGDFGPKKPGTRMDGYFYIILSNYEDERSVRKIHAIIAELFLGERPDGHEVCHADGNKENNWLWNLRYGTHAENMRDRARHGTCNSGERNGKSKLTWERAAEVRRLRATGMTQKQIGELMSVNYRTIANVLSGLTWNPERR